MGSLDRNEVLTLFVFAIVEELGGKRAKECLECIRDKNRRVDSDDQQNAIAIAVAQLADDALELLSKDPHVIDPKE